MLRLVTLALVVLLVACGGGGGGSADAPPSLARLFPVEDLAVGTLYGYDVVKSLFRGVLVGTKNKSLPLEIGRQVDPNGPDVHFVGFQGDATSGVGFMWTARGLEATLVAQAQFWGVDGLCVTATSPGLLVVPADFQPGDSHHCDPVASPVTALDVHWVGPEAVAGHPDAQRFDFDASGPYSQSSPTHPRFGATTVRILGTLYLAPDVGVVAGTVRQRFAAGANVLEERVYDLTLGSVTSGP